MNADQEQRLRDCAFDEDITYILNQLARWFDDDAADALVDCLNGIRSILSESVCESRGGEVP